MPTANTASSATVMASPVAPNQRDKPAAFAAYELALANDQKPMPVTMKKGLRIYMRGHVATRPCSLCIRLTKNPDADYGDDRRKPHFGGLCVMLGKDGGCCACIGAGAPGCNAEYKAALPPTPTSAAPPAVIDNSTPASDSGLLDFGKRRRDSDSPSTGGNPSSQPEPKRQMTALATARVTEDVVTPLDETAGAPTVIDHTDVGPIDNRGDAGVDILAAAINVGQNSSQPTAMRATSLAKHVAGVNSSISAERAQLQQRADELRRKLDDTTYQLDAVKSSSEALDKDEAFFSAIMDRTFIDMAHYFGDKHLAFSAAELVSSMGQRHSNAFSTSPLLSRVNTSQITVGGTASASDSDASDAAIQRHVTHPTSISAPAATADITAGSVNSPRSRRNHVKRGQRSIALTQDDLLTLATQRWVNDSVIKAYLDHLIFTAAVANAAAVAADVAGLATMQAMAMNDHHSLQASLASINAGRPVGSAYAFDPLFWPRLCAGDVSAWRGAIADASRCSVVLVPALVQGHRHWLLLVVLRDDRAIECYDSLRNDNRCWHALAAVETALVHGELQKYWAAEAAPASAWLAPSAAPASAAASERIDGTRTETGVHDAAIGSDDDIGRRQRSAVYYGHDTGAGGAADAEAHATRWQQRIVSCAQQPNYDDCGPYMLWFARRILLRGAAHARTDEPPPADWRMQIVRELSAQLDPGSGIPASSAPAYAQTAVAAAVAATGQRAAQAAFPAAALTAEEGADFRGA